LSTGKAPLVLSIAEMSASSRSNSSERASNDNEHILLGNEDDEDGGELYEGILLGGEEPEDEREKSLSQNH
jgi:hypothetical protein